MFSLQFGFTSLNHHISLGYKVPEDSQRDREQTALMESALGMFAQLFSTIFLNRWWTDQTVIEQLKLEYNYQTKFV